MIASRTNLLPLRPEEQLAAATVPIERNSAGLRDALFDEIDRLRRGEGDTKHALTIALLARGIISIAQAEHRLAKEEAPNPIPLGRRR